MYKERGGMEDQNTRLSKIRVSFVTLRKIWSYTAFRRKQSYIDTGGVSTAVRMRDVGNSQGTMLFVALFYMYHHTIKILLKRPKS